MLVFRLRVFCTLEQVKWKRQEDETKFVALLETVGKKRKQRNLNGIEYKREVKAKQRSPRKNENKHKTKSRKQRLGMQRIREVAILRREKNFSIFPMFSRGFPQFSQVFRGFQTCSDSFRSIWRAHTEAIASVLTLSAKNWDVLDFWVVFQHFRTQFLENIFCIAQ